MKYLKENWKKLSFIFMKYLKENWKKLSFIIAFILIFILMIVVIGVYSTGDNNNDKGDWNIKNTAENRTKINYDVYTFINDVRNWTRNINDSETNATDSVILNTVPNVKGDNGGVKWMTDHYTIKIMWMKDGEHNWGENWVWIKIGNPTSDYLMSAINNYKVWTSENLHFSTQ